MLPNIVLIMSEQRWLNALDVYGNRYAKWLHEEYYEEPVQDGATLPYAAVCRLCRPLRILIGSKFFFNTINK